MEGPNSYLGYLIDNPDVFNDIFQCWALNSAKFRGGGGGRRGNQN